MMKINARRRNLQKQMQQIINPEVKPKKITFDLKNSFKVNEANSESADVFSRRMIDSLDLPEFREYAPWNPVYNKPSTTIVLSKIK